MTRPRPAPGAGLLPHGAGYRSAHALIAYRRPPCASHNPQNRRGGAFQHAEIIYPLAPPAAPAGRRIRRRRVFGREQLARAYRTVPTTGPTARRKYAQVPGRGVGGTPAPPRPVRRRHRGHLWRFVRSAAGFPPVGRPRAEARRPWRGLARGSTRRGPCSEAGAGSRIVGGAPRVRRRRPGARPSRTTRACSTARPSPTSRASQRHLPRGSPVANMPTWCGPPAHPWRLFSMA